MGTKLLWCGIVVVCFIGVIMFTTVMSGFFVQMTDIAANASTASQFPEYQQAVRWSPLAMVYLIPIAVCGYAIFYILRSPEGRERIKEYMRRG